MKRSHTVLAILSLLVAPVAFAADTADQRFTAGMKAAEQGKFDLARQAFLDAYTLAPTQPTLWNLAMAEYKTGRSVDSIRHVRQYMLGSPREARYEALAPQIIERLATQTCHLEIESVQGAQIVVDGEKWPDPAPLTAPVDVAGGNHVIEATKGERGARANATCTAGQTIPVKVTFDEPAPPPIAPLPLAASTPGPAPSSARPGGDLGPSPSGGPASDSGGGGRFWSTGRIVGASVAGAGLVLGVTGFVVFSVQKGDARDEASSITSRMPPDNCRPNFASADCGRLRELGDNFDRAEVLRGVSLIAGGALVAGGVGWALLAGPKRAASTVVLPYASASGGGVGVTGAF